MLRIEDKNINWEFNGVKILSALNSSWTLLELKKHITTHKVFIDENILSINNCIIINEYTTLASLLGWTKSSQFLKNLVLAFDANSIVNNDKLEDFLKIMNSDSKDLINFNNDPIDLIIKNFQINKELRIDETNLKKVLDCYKQSNKKLTIIISNCFWFKFNLIKNYFSFFNFIIITNSLTYIGINSSELEDCVAIQNYKGDWYEVLDVGKLILYVEKESNSIFNSEKLNKYLSSNLFDNYEITTILRKIF